MYGVCRALATDTTHEGGQQRPRHIVWNTYGGYLIRAAPNQLEYASERERQLAELDGTRGMPCTILKGLSECQPGQYLDITIEAEDEDLLPEEAWRAPARPAAA